jgi:hypothetical protein
MNGEERYNSFIENIEDWIKSIGIIEVSPNESVEKSLSLSFSDLKNLSYEECQMLAYELYCYAEYVDSLLAKQKITHDWAEDAIWYIICDKINQYGDKYTKWQEKYFYSIKENPLASQILKVKNTAHARMEILKNKSENIKKISETLNNLAKRR